MGLHLALVELYDERGWAALATDKLDLMAALAELDGDAGRHRADRRREERSGLTGAGPGRPGQRPGAAPRAVGGGPEPGVTLAGRCPRSSNSLLRQITPAIVLDIAITALFIYWVFSLIRGTRAVTLVIGVTILFGIYALAQFLELRLFTQILQAGAVVGLFALVVVFQPELRRALERIGRVGTLGWLFAPAAERRVEHVAHEVSRAAGMLSRDGHGALIVLERETGLGEIAETGVMIHADLSHELLCTIFMPRTELHDGAVIIRGDTVLAAAALLPLTEMTLSERFGTRHRAALGITEDTDAVAVVVSEENGQMSVVERARIVRVPTEAQLERALTALLEAPTVPGGLGRGGPGGRRPGSRLRIVRRRGRSEAPPVPRHGPSRTRRARPPPCRTRERGPRAFRRAGRTIVHNWPLKLAAIVLATLLYAGLVASQDSNTYPGPITVTPVNQPADTVITNQLRDVEQIQYIAPADLGRLRADDFRATVDLANVKPDGNPVSLRVDRHAPWTRA